MRTPATLAHPALLIRYNLTEGVLALAVRDFDDLLRLLAEHPEWAARLRAGRLDGWLLEYEYRSKPDAFLGERLRPPRAVAPGDLVEQLEPCASAQDLRDWSKVDLVVHGRAADRPDRPEVWPVVERAVRRAS